MPSNDDSRSNRHGHSHRRHTSRFGKVAARDDASAPPVDVPLPSAYAGFKEPAKRLKIHPLELALLAVVGAHLVFLPWALGTMRLPAQLVSLAFAVVGFVIALWPREYGPEHTGGAEFRLLPYPKLLRFPIFWLGLALLGLIVIQGLNPAWEYRSNGKSWWMQAIPHITWLPHGTRGPLVQAPGLPQGGPWRNLIIYSSAFLTVCSIWVGFTRRRTLQWFFLTLVFNGVALALLGFLERFAHVPYVELFSPTPGAYWFSSFVYKNHAGAYFDLIIAVTCGMGAWYYYRGVRRMEKSTPGGMFAFLVTLMAIGVLVSFARGATLTMAAYLVLAGGGFIIHQLFFAPKVTRKPVVIVILLLVFGFFLKTGLQAVNTGEAWNRIKEGVENGGDYSLQSRLTVTRATAEMIPKHAIVGTGSGSFGYLFPQQQLKYPEIWYTDGHRMFWLHAHNDWVEFPLELGATGMLLILGGFVAYGLALIRSYFWTNPMSILTVLGLVAVLAYSYWDFPFQNPAILITWLALWPAITHWTELEEQRR